jgi:uncharacterized membrane protein YjgN (DUF898 family)
MNNSLREGGTMKKMILVLMVVLALGMVGKGIYTAWATFDNAKTLAMGCTLTDAYPCQMPATVMEPCTGYTLF